MTFDEALERIRELLQSKGRVAYRALKRRFELDDEYLEDLKAELIDAEQVARDEDGKVLVWVGAPPVPSSTFQVQDSPPPTPGAQHPAERRQLTVLFCDLVGSTTLSEQLDPEEYSEVVRAYQDTCTKVIRRYDGHVAQHLGDGLLVYFGYPTAHEDDAQRAVRTGLEIVAALQNAESSNPRPPLEQHDVLGSAAERRVMVGRSFKAGLQVRIGIHTGPVVVGEIGSGEKREQLALGETPNIAARLQGLAAPNAVVISAATQRLVAGLFDCQDLGLQTLKGISTPVAVYQVLGEGTAQSRFEAAVQSGLTPLVGRELEMELLRERWQRVTQSAGQVVLLSGEPGIGKSRLVQALREHVLHDGATRLELRCSPYHQQSAYYPIIDHLQRFLQFTSQDTAQTKLDKLAQALARYHFPQVDTLPLLAAFLSLPHPEQLPPLTVSPQKQKEKTQEAIVAWLVEEAEKASVCCAWEDLHWADPSTLELLTLLMAQVPATRLLVLLTFRPEFIPPWGNRSHVSQLTLSRLGRSQVETIIERVTGGKTLSTEVVQQIVAKTDGVPLFVEELTKSVVESDLGVGATGRSPLPLGIPATLQDALMARLDRLAPVREIAQVGAVLGREFSYEILHVVFPLNEESLQRGLQQLVEAELVYQRGVPPQAAYVFKHALIQDTAYQSLLKSRRQQLHQQIAQVLAERFPETVETQPELVAHHYTEAGLAEQAIPYWQQAGRKGIARSANFEAIAHLRKALDLVTTVPDLSTRLRQELDLQTLLGPPLMAAKGIAASEVERTYTRAQELCQQLGESTQLFTVLRGLMGVYVMRAELSRTYALTEQCFTLAQQTKSPASVLWVHYFCGMTLYFLGDFTSAATHLEQGLALYDPQKRRLPRALHDPSVACLSYAAWTLCQRGYLNQGLTSIQEALVRAHELNHPYSTVFALLSAAQLHQLRQEAELARSRAEAAITLATEHDFPEWVPQAMIRRGWALAILGKGEEGIAVLRQGLAGLQSIGMELGRSSYLALLGEAYGHGGQVEEGLTTVAEALDFVDRTEERFYEAELYRLKGTLTLQSQVKSHKSKVEEAEGCFQKAIDIARKQSAKSLELRATTSLARLWQSQSKQREACTMLSEIYNWFTEGFDTKDLQEAKALLEELS